MNEWIRLIDSSTIVAGTAIVRLLVGFLLGAIIGAERQARRREAGLRTFTLICLGSTMSMLVSIWIPQTYPNFLNGDPGRIAAQCSRVSVSSVQVPLSKVRAVYMD